MLQIILAIVASLAIAALVIVSFKLASQKRVNNGLADEILEKDETIVRLKESLTAKTKYERKRFAKVHEELRASREFAMQIERFSNDRINDMTRELRGAHGLIEMLITGVLDNGVPVNVKHKEFRRLLVE